MIEPARAVFLSHASQDAEAARRIPPASKSGSIRANFGAAMFGTKGFA